MWDVPQTGCLPSGKLVQAGFIGVRTRAMSPRLVTSAEGLARCSSPGCDQPLPPDAVHDLCGRTARMDSGTLPRRPMLPRNMSGMCPR